MVYAGQLALCSCLIHCFEQGLSLYQSECTGAEAQIDFREPLPTHRAWCDDENTEIRLSCPLGLVRVSESARG